MSRRHAATLAPVLAGALLLGGCGDGGAATSGADGDQLEVLASFYPLQFVVEQVGGDAVSVDNLTKPGGEPHDLELAPRDVGRIGSADLVVYLRGFQPAVDDAVAEQAGDHALDVEDAARLDLTFSTVAAAVGEAEAHADEHVDHSAEEHSADEHGDHSADEHADHSADEQGHDHEAEPGATDPHFWLDPTRLADVGDAVADRLAELQPDRAADFTAAAQQLRSQLEELDGEIETGLASCSRGELVTSHTAFGYLAQRYGLTQVGISGLTPEGEPRPQDLAAVSAYVSEHDVGTIYYETLVSPAVAATVAAETGAATAVLDPLEGLTDASAGADYVEVMRANLATLRDGQGCS